MLGSLESAYLIAKAEFLPSSVADEMGLLRSTRENPEQQAIKHQLINTISEDSKYIILLILESEEKEGLRSISGFLQSIGWPRRVITKCFEEIGDFIRSIVEE